MTTAKEQEQNFATLITEKLGGEYDPETMGGDSPDIYQTDDAVKVLRDINAAITAASQPRPAIFARTKAEIDAELPMSDQLSLAQNPNRDGILRGLVDAKLTASYRAFIDYLEKIERYIIEETIEAKKTNSTRPSAKFLARAKYEELTLADWLKYIETFNSYHRTFRETFSQSGMRPILAGLQIANLDAFLNRKIVDHLADARRAGVKF